MNIKTNSGVFSVEITSDSRPIIHKNNIRWNWEALPEYLREQLARKLFYRLGYDKKDPRTIPSFIVGDL